MLLKKLFCGNLMYGKFQKRLSPDDIKQRLKSFLLGFEDTGAEPELAEPYDRFGRMKYMIMMQKIANQELRVLDIFVEDLEQFFRKEEERPILEGVKKNVKRYVEFFYQITDTIMPKRTLSMNPEESLRFELENALRKQREENFRMAEEKLLAENELIPNKMSRRYSVIISYKYHKASVTRTISQIDSDMIGALSIVKGIVIRTDDVRPRLSVGTFTCDVCGCENYLEVLNEKFNPLQQCQSKKCQENKVAGKLTFLPYHSSFVPCQEIVIQEVPEQLNQGNIPRNLKLLLTESNVKMAHPGDIIEIQGVILPKRKQKSMHDEDILFDSRMEAFKVIKHKKHYVDMAITEQDRAEIQEIRQSMPESELFKALASSIAPEIYGLDCVKKALLLLLAGGVTAVTHDNMKIRGEINILLVGDPGLAKSQLLKYISCLAPRGVYTTGKGSSDVGLTAAIKIDPVTRDVSLEAGALVLADMGVCCIDEFDKMTEYDRTAIHEVMEQQTVSIAKAGLTTTLNARTSVLAAANPLFSRYNPNETAQKNINLQAALLSRFDLIFILLDRADPEKDLSLAKHIGKVHQNKGAHQSTSSFSIKTLRNYIALSKEYQPKISHQLCELLVERYVKNRRLYSDKVREGERYITTRNLLALIRLCQARARLRFSNDINKEDIQECEQIMQESQHNASFEADNGPHDKRDDLSACYKMVIDMFDYCEEGNKVIEMSNLVKRVQAKGLSVEALNLTLQQYSKLNVIMVDSDSRIHLTEHK